MGGGGEDGSAAGVGGRDGDDVLRGADEARGGARRETRRSASRSLNFYDNNVAYEIVRPRTTERPTNDRSCREDVNPVYARRALYRR